MRLAVQLALTALAAWTTSARAADPTPATVAARPPAEAAGRGAVVPFTEYEAENAVTNGAAIGPDRRFGTLAAEASGRRAVRLQGKGSFVAFTLAKDANALTIRYAVPDSPDGAGLDATLGLYVDGGRIGDLRTTSRYGWFYGRYPFANRPADGGGHHFYDHTRILLDRTLPAGTTVRLMVGENDRAPWYAIDLLDAEVAPPPLARPAGSLSVVDFGADPTGARESARAFGRAIATARRQGRPLWLPPGTFTVNRHLTVDRVTISGAGIWHTTIRGRGVGLYGRKAPRGSTAVTLRDFAVIGEVTERNDKISLSGVGGAMGGGTRIENLWLQHHKVGLWFDGPMDGIVVSGLRIFDVTADGLNFRGGVTNAVMENSFIRGSGDDGLAAWSSPKADHGLVFRRNTVIAPVLANGIAIYGGYDIAVIGNMVADTVTQGGGIHVGNRFKAVPVSGDIAIVDNLIVRSGSFDPNWRHGVGALWFYALDAPMTATIAVTNTDIVDSSEEAVMFTGLPISGVSLDRVAITGAGSHAVTLRSPGSASLSNVSARKLGGAAILRCDASFDLRLGHGISLRTHAAEPCGAQER